jgi:hypothetical protein
MKSFVIITHKLLLVSANHGGRDGWKCVECLVYKSLRKGQLGRRRHRWKNNTKIDLKEAVCECVDKSVRFNKKPSLLL